MSWLTALLEIIAKILGLFYKSPEQKRKEAELELNAAIDKANKTRGDTSYIDDLINRR